MIKKFKNFKEEPIIEYFDNGNKKSEYWYLNGEYHKENIPAVQWWYKNGQKKSENWFLNNKRHREDGSAYQIWYENGQKEFEFWYLNDIRYSREEWIEELKNIGSKHYEEQKMLFDLDKYNL